MIRILLSTRLGERRWTQADLARATEMCIRDRGQSVLHAYVVGLQPLLDLLQMCIRDSLSKFT